MFNSDRKSSKFGAYEHHGELRGHSGAILAMSATEDGRFLASGGTDGTRVFDIRTMRAVESPQSSEWRGPTTAVLWLKREDDAVDGLVSGTQRGYLFCWETTKQRESLAITESYCVRLFRPAEITGLAYDPPTRRLAVCHRGGLVQVFKMPLTPVYTVELSSMVPRAVAFGQLRGNERDVLVFSLYDGEIHHLRGRDGTASHLWNVGGLIGHAQVNLQKGVMCMDDPSTGTSIYRLEDCSRLKTFPVKVTKKKRIRNVAFVNECKVVVSGSDHGVVYLFDRRSGKTIDELMVHSYEWVQTVTTSENDGVCTIFAAKSRDLDGPNDISVWRKRELRASAGTIMYGILVFVQACFVVGVAIVVFFNRTDLIRF